MSGNDCRKYLRPFGYNLEDDVRIFLFMKCVADLIDTQYPHFCIVFYLGARIQCLLDF